MKEKEEVQFGNEILLSEFTFRQMVQNSCHLGENLAKHKWFEENRFFILGLFRKQTILDLSISVVSTRSAIVLVEKLSFNGLKVLLAAQHPLMRTRLKSECDIFVQHGLYYVHSRWVGGIVSNFKRLSLYVFPYLISRTDVIYASHSRFKKRWQKLYNLFSGLRNSYIPPSFTFGSSIKYNPWLVRESVRLSIPHASLIDSDSVFSGLVTYPIASSDASVSAMLLFSLVFKNSFFLGLLQRRRMFVFLLNNCVSVLRKRNLDTYFITLNTVLRFIERIVFFLHFNE
jgi:ribosomal protein S2